MNCCFQLIARHAVRVIYLSRSQQTLSVKGHMVIILGFVGHALAVVCLCVCFVAQSCLTLCNPKDCSPLGSSVHGNPPGKNTGVGCHVLLQGFSQPRDRTQVSCIAGRFFTS